MACGLSDDRSLHCWSSALPVRSITLDGEYLAISPAGRLCGAPALGGITCWTWDHGAAEFVVQDVRDMTGKYTVLAAGEQHVCGILENGRIECSESGAGFHGPGRATPPEGEFIFISAAQGHTCGVRKEGNLECWGAYPFFQDVPEAGNFAQVVSTGTKACALSQDGSVECWGSTQSPAGKSFRSISLGQNIACGVLNDGQVSCWRP